MLVAGRCGELRRVALDGTSVAVATLPVVCSGDRGLLGLDVAPDYAASGTLYTLYDYSGNVRAGSVM